MKLPAQRAGLPGKDFIYFIATLTPPGRRACGGAPVMSKKHFREYICRPYCIFFKEGEKEELACRGARIVELLVKKNRIVPAEIPPMKKGPSLWNAWKAELGRHVCRRCSFRAGDCDFQSGSPPDYAEPCGGFILLAHLRTNNLIDESDLEEHREG
jgi:hypothetical protein